MYCKFSQRHFLQDKQIFQLVEVIAVEIENGERRKLCKIAGYIDKVVMREIHPTQLLAIKHYCIYDWEKIIDIWNLVVAKQQSGLNFFNFKDLLLN